MNATDPIPPDDPDELPEISQMMPLHDFPPFRPNVRVPRPLTPAESRELQLRGVVQDKLQVRSKDCKARRRMRRCAILALFVALAIFSLPTIEQYVIDPIDHEANSVSVALVSHG